MVPAAASAVAASDSDCAELMLFDTWLTWVLNVALAESNCCLRLLVMSGTAVAIVLRSVSIFANAVVSGVDRRGGKRQILEGGDLSIEVGLGGTGLILGLIGRRLAAAATAATAAGGSRE